MWKERTLIMGKMKVRTIILGKMKVHTHIMIKIKVRNLILALSNVSEPLQSKAWMICSLVLAYTIGDYPDFSLLLHYNWTTSRHY